MKQKLKQSLIIAGVAVFAIDFLVAKFNKPKIYLSEKLPYGYNAQTLPPIGIVVQDEDKENKALIKHELVLWKQYQKLGSILFYAKYLFQKFWYGYDKMPMEVEARLKSGETPYCAENYTECVRTGKSITVYEPKFRR